MSESLKRSLLAAFAGFEPQNYSGASEDYNVWCSRESKDSLLLSATIHRVMKMCQPVVSIVCL